MSRSTTINRLFVPGGGLECRETGPCQPSMRTRLRADTVIRYFYEHRESFESPHAFIAISGGHTHTLPSSSLEKNTEAASIKAALAEHGVPERLSEGRIDDQATDTADNMITAVEQGILRPTDYSPEAPLGVVTYPAHGERIELYLRCLGLYAESLIVLDTHEEPKPEEPYLYAQTAALEGVKVGDAEELRRRQKALVAHLHRPENRNKLLSLVQ